MVSLIIKTYNAMQHNDEMRQTNISQKPDDHIWSKHFIENQVKLSCLSPVNENLEILLTISKILLCSLYKNLFTSKKSLSEGM